MRSVLIVAALLVASSTAVAEPYVFAGGSAGTKYGGLNLGAGVRSSNVGLEAAYAGEHRKAEQLADDGADGISTKDVSRQWHGASIGLVGFAPITKLPATGVPVEIVGRAARARMRSGDLEEWRTAIGAGVQYGERGGLGVRALLERAGDQTVLSLSLIKAF